jgi:hypothetical protein
MLHQNDGGDTSAMDAARPTSTLAAIVTWRWASVWLYELNFFISFSAWPSRSWSPSLINMSGVIIA